MKRFCPFCLTVVAFVSLFVIFLTLAIMISAGNELSSTFNPVEAFGKKAVKLSKEHNKNLHQ